MNIVNINTLNDALSLAYKAFLSGGFSLDFLFKIKSQTYMVNLDGIRDITKRIAIDNFEQFFKTCIQDINYTVSKNDTTYSKVIQYAGNMDLRIDICLWIQQNKDSFHLKLMSKDYMENTFNMKFTSL